jgi:hypothetical protein
MNRKFTGPVLGGPNKAHVPSFSGANNQILPHAIGRVDAMSDSLIHAAVLQSKGLFRIPIASYTGAKFQDFRSTPNSGFVRAHRAVFAPNIGGSNIASLPNIDLQSKLWEVLIAPQSRTDPMTPIANYGDRLFEIVSAEKLLQRFNNILSLQRNNSSVEIGGVIEQIIKMRDDIVGLYNTAIAKSEDILKGRGYQIKELKSVLLNEGPKSELVEESINLTLIEAGPSQFADAPQIYLAACQDCTKAFYNFTYHDVEKVAETVEKTIVDSGVKS